MKTLLINKNLFLKNDIRVTSKGRSCIFMLQVKLLNTTTWSKETLKKKNIDVYRYVYIDMYDNFK